MSSGIWRPFCLGLNVLEDKRVPHFHEAGFELPGHALIQLLNHIEFGNTLVFTHLSALSFKN